ncbi:MAG: DNA-directed RNA polymerase subunit beta' [Patescibacteria group bacterium]
MENKTNQNSMKMQKMNPSEFDLMSLKLASPERILEWSFGEIVKPETINYRTQRSERGGLFDEKIFGPEKDYECYCGKYRGIRYRGIICEKCGVEITRSIVRRERMGHIELASPVSHIWYLKGVPSRIAMILGVSSADVEKVVYFAGYIVTGVSEEERMKLLKELDNEYKNKLKSIEKDDEKEKLKELFAQVKKDISNIDQGQILDDLTYNRFAMKYGGLFEAETGAEAVYTLFKRTDMEKLAGKLESELERSGSVEKEKIYRRLSLIKSMNKANVRPEWMFLSRIPVIPPALRPMVALDGGRHATSDINDLYRRVINRNNRLKKLLEINAPAVILRNEKRILQEAVDALIDNSIRNGSSYSVQTQSQRRSLKSLSDNLKGKQGLFRQNLLGKRVDYSGRSVIVVGPDLSLDECGLPKLMALELFRPFVISELLKKEVAFNIRGANRLIDDGIPEVWAILEEVTKDKYVLLNRAPTLHRLGIQAFKPILIEGNAIQIHPLICTAFNADFDGDQMAVHLPLSDEAQMEAREIIASAKNLLKPGNGEPVASAKMLDIVLGSYWVTKIIIGEKGEGKYFASPNSAITASDFGIIDIRAKIKVLGTDSPRYSIFNGQVFETSVGRLLFNSTLPKDYPYINKEIDAKAMSSIVHDIMDKYENSEVPKILDKIKDFGFKYVTISGITWGIDDVTVPVKKKEIIEKGRKQSEENYVQYNEGLLSEDERRTKNIEIWHGVKNEIETVIPDTLVDNTSVKDMWLSGARGSLSQITQMVGMKGLIQNTVGETIEVPILSSNKEGLNPIEYFIATHGARKGLSDTALNTAEAGYLTRRLFDVSQDVIIKDEDCGSKDGIIIKNENASGMVIPISRHIFGRIILEDIKDKEDKVIFQKGHFLNKKDALLVENSGIIEVLVRSPLSCKNLSGICRKCYGVDLATNKLVNLGEAIGTVAAQAVGEPGTQLTMRTFHSGGAASVGGDITAGLPRVAEIFDRRKPKNPAVIASVSGTVYAIEENGKEKIISVMPDEGEKKKGTVDFTAYFGRTIFVKKGDKVNKGDLLTDGSADLEELFKYAGKEKTENYIIHEISKIYERQGASISRKHIEVIIRQMFSRRRIKEPGGTIFTRGDIVEMGELVAENKRVKDLDKEEAKAENLLRGITEVALTRKSFLSAASFQNTPRILINASVRGAKDELRGLKENVIIGRLIPAGTGYEGSPKFEMIKKLQEKIAEEENSKLEVREEEQE